MSALKIVQGNDVVVANKFSFAAGLTTEQRLGSARAMGRRVMRWLADAVLALTPHPVPGLKTEAVTEGGVFCYDPERWATIGCADALFGVLHEPLHVQLRTLDRCRAMHADPAMFNLAADLAINDMLRQFGVMPRREPGVWMDPLPEDYKLPQNQTTEWYYTQLQQQGAAKPEEPGCGKGWCGSGAGMPIPGEPQAGQKDKQGNDPPRPRSKADLDLVRAKVAAAVKAAAQNAQGLPPGIMQGEMGILIELMEIESKVAWEEQLRRAASLSISTDPGCYDATFTRPSRRQQPGMHQPRCPAYVDATTSVTLLIDVSGSMLDGDKSRLVARVVAEVPHIMRRLGVPSVHICTVDTVIQGMGDVRSMEEVLPLLKGGGGTDFCSAFEQLSVREPRTRLLIVGTDGYAGVPKEQPEGIDDLVWLLVGGNKDAPAEYGTAIVVDD